MSSLCTLAIGGLLTPAIEGLPTLGHRPAASKGKVVRGRKCETVKTSEFSGSDILALQKTNVKVDGR